MTTKNNLFGKWRPYQCEPLADGQKLRATTYLSRQVEGVMEGHGIRITEYSGLAYEPGDFIELSRIRKRTLEVWGA